MENSRERRFGNVEIKTNIETQPAWSRGACECGRRSSVEVRNDIDKNGVAAIAMELCEFCFAALVMSGEFGKMPYTLLCFREHSKDLRKRFESHET